MKQLLFGCAVTILWCFFAVYQLDNNQFIRMQENLKLQANECANTGSLYYDLEQFSEGKKVFDKNKANEAIEKILKLNLRLNNKLEPDKDSYWKKTIEYYVYYIDDSIDIKDSFEMVEYKNGILISAATSVSYNYMFKEPLTNYEKEITEPTIIVVINAGHPRFRLSFLEPGDVVRSSGYEYVSY